MIEDEGDNPSQVKLLYVLEYRDCFMLVSDHMRMPRNVLKRYEKFELKC